MPKWSEKSLTIGILFLTFSLTIFRLSQLGWGMKVVAVGFFVASVLCLIKVLWDMLGEIVRRVCQKPVGTASKAGNVRSRRNLVESIGAGVSEGLWFVIIGIFLTTYVLALGNGTAQMKWNPLGGSVVVIGIIWFIVVFMALFAKLLPQQQLKSQAYAVVAVISLAFLFCGIVVASTAADHQWFLSGTFLAVFGATVPLAFWARVTLARYSPF